MSPANFYSSAFINADGYVRSLLNVGECIPQSLQRIKSPANVGETNQRTWHARDQGLSHYGKHRNCGPPAESRLCVPIVDRRLYRKTRVPRSSDKQGRRLERTIASTNSILGQLGFEAGRLLRPHRHSVRKTTAPVGEMRRGASRKLVRDCLLTPDDPLLVGH